MKFEKIENVTYDYLLEVLPAYLKEISPNLYIVAERIALGKEESPFLLALKGGEKRIGILELLEDTPLFPSRVLSHAAWLSQNSQAIKNLKKLEFNPDLPPFIIGLLPEKPEWIHLCAYLKPEIMLFKYTAVSFQGASGLILEPLIESSLKKREIPVLVAEEPAFPPVRGEAVNEMGLTEAELRFFSN